MALVGTDGRWLQVNRALTEIIGYSEKELLDTTFQAITHLEELANTPGGFCLSVDSGDQGLTSAATPARVSGI